MRLTEGGILVGVALLVLFAAWLQVGALWCFRLGHWFLSSGRRNAVRRVAWCLDFVPWRRGEYSAAYLRIRVASDEGQTSVALERLEELLQKLEGHPLLASTAAASFIDVWVNAGQYRRAVLAPRRSRWRTRARGAREVFGIAQVNRAEALHNLGRDRLALALLRRQRARLKASRIGKNGALALEAWIRAQLGQTERARRAIERLDPRPLSPYYAAEIHFTRALVELSGGKHDLAFEEATAGLAGAVRASSERNGHFLIGRIEAARGNTEEALKHYERGRMHRYRAQGGGSLLELAQLYERLGQPQGARDAYGLLLERDPESAAALVGRKRLDQLGG
jgi:tetratricopeptide (TPR) repeat protein